MVKQSNMSRTDRDRDTHAFSSDLFLCELHLNEGPYSGKQLPPGPALHSFILLDVLLDAADGQVMGLPSTQRERVGVTVLDCTVWAESGSIVQCRAISTRPTEYRNSCVLSESLVPTREIISHQIIIISLNSNVIYCSSR